MMFYERGDEYASVYEQIWRLEDYTAQSGDEMKYRLLNRG